MSQAKLYREALKEARRLNPGASDDDLIEDGEVDEIISRWQADAAEDAQYIEDTPCLQPEQFMSFHG